MKPFLTAFLTATLFSLPAVAQTVGHLTLERWTNLPTQGGIEILKEHGISQRPADHTELLAGAATGTSWGDYYGVRLRGTFIAPIDGDYTFFIASDNDGELWLSPSSSALDKQLIAHHSGWTGLNQWDQFETQRSGQFTLQAGESYYIEGLMRERDRGDHLSIGWAYETPVALQQEDIDSPVSASWTQSNGTYEASVVSGDIWGNSDRCSTNLRPWSGDGEFIARINSLNNAEPWAKAGIMLRASKNADAENALIALRGSNGMTFQYRSTTGGNTSSTKISAEMEWVKLVRKGDVLTGYASPDGQTWTLINSYTISGLPTDVFVGLALSNHDNAEPASATFSEFSTSPLTASEVIPASQLTSHAPDSLDANDNNLPDAFESEFPLTGTAFDVSEFGDPDGDSYTNLAESQMGTNPLVANSFLLERWNNINGYRIDELVSNPAFYGEPDSQQFVSPSDLEFSGTYFGSRIRGYIIPETSGHYTFWISARNSAKLFLSDDTTEGKYAKRLIAILDPTIGTAHGVRSDAANLWDQYTSQRSEPIHLEAGQSYYLEILHQNGHNSAPHASIAWARDGGPRTAIPASMVESYVTTPDDAVDDDYLPDAWEIQYGLDPNDNGAIDPERQGERGDYDMDGLSNRLEYLYGTDPTNPDTDGDGIIDSVEINSYGTDPTVSDAPSGLLTSTLDLTSFTAADSDWTLTSQGLVPASFRGAISWDFAVPSDGFWLLDIATTLMGDLYLHETVDIEVIINGTSMGKQTLIYGRDRHALLRVFTPYLTAGNHSLELKIHNTITRRMVSINDISVIQPQGADLNGDGIPDWIAAQIDGENALRPYSVSSRTSPANLEGSARMRSLTTLNGTPVTAGLDHSHWYADLPLDPAAATPFIVSFETNITETGSITWQATNVFNQETLTVRRGDALKLIGQPTTGPTGQSVTLTFGPAGWNGNPGASGTTEVALASDSDHHLYTLTQAGNYKVRATHANGSTALMSIAVKKANFSATPKDLVTNKIGIFSFNTSAVSPTNHFDGGQTLHATNPATITGSTIKLQVAPKQNPGHTNLLARLHEDGPILGHQSVNLINFTDVMQNNSDFTYQSADFPGYYIIRSPIVVTDLPQGATVVVRIFRAGVTFLDGTKVLTLTADDFQNGIYNLEFLFPEGLHGGYCHYVDVYDRHGNHLSRR